jgi:hypothetical protein
MRISDGDGCVAASMPRTSHPQAYCTNVVMFIANLAGIYHEGRNFMSNYKT